MSVHGEPAAELHGRDNSPPGRDTILLEIRVARAADGAESGPPSERAPEPMLLRIEEAARLLAISRATLYPMLGRQIPVVRIGRAVRVPRGELERFLASAVDTPESAGAMLVDHKTTRQRRNGS
jgi:excisionase family DNA binding protein